MNIGQNNTHSHDRLARLVDICEMIEQDAEKDVTRYEGMPFDGKTVAAYQGEQNAMTQALAKGLKLVAQEILAGSM